MNDTTVFLCPRCLTASETAGECEVCGGARVGCRPGAPDDPCRRPIIDGKGRVRTRAPLWWLRTSVRPLTEDMERRERSTT